MHNNGSTLARNRSKDHLKWLWDNGTVQPLIEYLRRGWPHLVHHAAGGDALEQTGQRRASGHGRRRDGPPGRRCRRRARRLHRRSREDMDRCAALLKEMNATIVHRPDARQLGSGLLLRAVRGSRRHQARSELCAGHRASRGWRSVQLCQRATSEAPVPLHHGDGLTISEP